MDLRWNLDKLYTSFKDDDFLKDFNGLDNEISKINDYSENNFNSLNNAKEKIEEYINKLNLFTDIYIKLFNFCELTTSVDVSNEDAIKYSEAINKKLSNLTKSEVLFQNFLNKLDNIDEIIKSPILKEHEFFIYENLRKGKHLLSEKEETLLSKMKNTGSTAWANLQNLLTSTLLVDINIDGKDEKLPLPMVRNFANDKNKNLRKKAYEAELLAYEKVAKSSSFCLNNIKGEVILISDLKGYKSPLDMTLENSRMDKETLDAMLIAINESLPSFRKYFKKKAELLGYKNGLPFYEMFAPMGSLDKEFSFQDASDFIVKNFNTFSDELSDFAKNAFDNNWIDAEIREGKSGGAFCSNIHPIKESRILSNFTGSFSDIVTLAHELGHGYHGSCLDKETALNSDYPMPIAETASIFCETIIKNAALKDVSKEESLTILENSISDSAQVIVDIYSRFLFESKLFEIREDHSLSVDELKTIMLNAQKQAYGDGLDKNYLHPYMWLCKPHYYYSEANFYNFPYAFGLLFSKGLYSKYLEDKENFPNEYKKLLSYTGKADIYNVAKIMDIDIHSIDFWRSSLKLVEEEIEEFIK
ncbi:MAG: M3 family oligoendopeptidase [Clostridiaceae bacterium]